jgi:hypothetical protein
VAYNSIPFVGLDIAATRCGVGLVVSQGMKQAPEGFPVALHKKTGNGSPFLDVVDFARDILWHVRLISSRRGGPVACAIEHNTFGHSGSGAFAGDLVGIVTYELLQAEYVHYLVHVNPSRWRSTYGIKTTGTKGEKERAYTSKTNELWVGSVAATRQDDRMDQATSMLIAGCAMEAYSARYMKGQTDYSGRPAVLNLAKDDAAWIKEAFK